MHLCRQAALLTAAPAAFLALWRHIQVDALLNEVIAAMQDLYDRRKLEYGWAHRPLSIE